MDYDETWTRVLEEFRRRDVTTLAAAVDQAGLDRSFVDRALGVGARPDRATRPDRPLDRQRLAADFRSHWSSAGSQPMSAAYFAAYLYVQAQRAWELTVEHDDITRTLRAAIEGWRAAVSPATPEARVVHLMLAHARTLEDCLRAENALNCSCPVALARHAQAVASANSRLLAQCAPMTPPWTCAGRFLEGVIGSHATTYGAIAAGADAVLAWIEKGAEARTEVRRAVQALQDAEVHPSVREDVYASELRAHRRVLTEIAARLGGPGTERLEIDEAKFIYCFPFALKRMRGNRAVENARSLWGPDTSRGMCPRLAGETPEGIEPLDLSDIWDSSLYSGAVLELPPLLVRTTADELLEHRAEIRFSVLGNHYVRISRVGTSLHLHDLNQGLRRGTSVMGEEEVTGGGERRWTALQEYANDVITAVVQALHAGEAGDSDLVLVDLRSHSNVIVEIRSAHFVDADGDRREAAADDVLRVAGSLLLQPVQGYAAALEEWMRVSLPDSKENVLGNRGFEGDVVVRTENTTIVIMPGTPNWGLIGKEEEVEFVASLPPLVLTWQDSLDRAKDDVLKRLPSGPASVDDTRWEHLPALDQDKTSLERLRLTLQAEAARAREQSAVIHSARLCQPMTHRQFVDRLFAEAGLPRLEAELEASMVEVNSLYERVASYATLSEEQRTAKYKRVVEIFLVVLTTASLAGFLDWFNRVFVLEQDVSRQVAVFEIAILLALATAVVAVVLKGGRRRKADHRHG